MWRCLEAAGEWAKSLAAAYTRSTLSAAALSDSESDWAFGQALMVLRVPTWNLQREKTAAAAAAVVKLCCCCSGPCTGYQVVVETTCRSIVCADLGANRRTVAAAVLRRLLWSSRSTSYSSWRQPLPLVDRLRFLIECRLVLMLLAAVPCIEVSAVVVVVVVACLCLYLCCSECWSLGCCCCSVAIGRLDCWHLPRPPIPCC